MHKSKTYEAIVYVSGRLSLPPPKPVLANSELTKKTLSKDPLPPIQSKDQQNGKGKGAGGGEGGGRSTTAYRIDFEGDQIKTSKNSKFGPTPRVLGTARMMNKTDSVDDRYGKTFEGQPNSIPVTQNQRDDKYECRVILMLQIPFGRAGTDAMEERGARGKSEAWRAGRGRGGLPVGQPCFDSLRRVRLSLRLTESEP